VGAVEASIGSWPTQAWGSAAICAARSARCAVVRVQPSTERNPRERDVGLITKRSRLAITWLPMDRSPHQ